MVKVLLITGNHPRHLYAAGQIALQHEITGWVIQDRGEFLPQAPPPNQFLDSHLQNLFDKHFRSRYDCEHRFFVDEECDFNLLSAGFVASLCNHIHHTNKESLNSMCTGEFLSSVSADVAISYGCSVLKNELLDRMPMEKYNLHGGLSPWYRGCITHFWPSYMLEPYMTGMTMHRLTSVLDGGEIIHQNTASLVRGDGLHELACRSVRSFLAEVPIVISSINNGEYHLHTQRSAGKLWTASDWDPSHLKFVYDYFQNQIVDYCLDLGKTEVSKQIIRASL